MGIEEALPHELRGKLRADLLAADDKFVLEIPKVELHVHIEGTLTLNLRWKLTQRNGTILRLVPNGPELHSLEELHAAMDSIMPDSSRMNNDEERDMFFESYFEGFQALKTEEDYYDLAMNYFEHAASMNVRYCEPFFDPQGHTSRGVSWSNMMDGFRKAQKEAEEKLNIKSSWIMCFLRDHSPESATEHYKAAQPYRDMIVGIGLDSCEEDRRPSLFEEVFAQARGDGFKLTMHCDVDQKNTPKHIRQVVSVVAGEGTDRIDHGLNASDDRSLIDLILKRDMGMTICPWSYLRHTTYAKLGQRIRALYDAGIKITINSDDPAFMDDCWILHNFLLAKHLCGFSDRDITVLARNAINVSWAEQSVKDNILREIEIVYDRFHSSQ
ncbi:putative adenosine deaminase [Mollisia scopiformis]|uniref:Putative adenosine deaminase n=1 Tax=Mollisia scopiformis TaxID=149040 RepID=A0A194XAR6_MOLSC|nr:putative adenosine deaminase [Mollisia scopiformis]KUJ17253.1 putative adenosine deaminase [Mollisia scopiformis]